MMVERMIGVQALAMGLLVGEEFSGELHSSCVGSNCWLWMQRVPKMYDSDAAVNSFPPDRCAGGPFYALPP